VRKASTLTQHDDADVRRRQTISVFDAAQRRLHTRTYTAIVDLSVYNETLPREAEHALHCVRSSVQPSHTKT